LTRCPSPYRRVGQRAPQRKATHHRGETGQPHPATSGRHLRAEVLSVVSDFWIERRARQRSAASQRVLGLLDPQWGLSPDLRPCWIPPRGTHGRAHCGSITHRTGATFPSIQLPHRSDSGAGGRADCGDRPAHRGCKRSRRRREISVPLNTGSEGESGSQSSGRRARQSEESIMG
jgi:hypothetical protein